MRLDTPSGQSSPFVMQIANKLRHKRIAMNLTLKEVAKRCQSTPQTIQRLETGNMTLSVEWVERLCTALEIEPPELFNGMMDIHKKMDQMQADIKSIRDEAEALAKHLNIFLNGFKK